MHPCRVISSCEEFTHPRRICSGCNHIRKVLKYQYRLYYTIHRPTYFEFAIRRQKNNTTPISVEALRDILGKTPTYELKREYKGIRQFIYRFPLSNLPRDTLSSSVQL